MDVTQKKKGGEAKCQESLRKDIPNDAGREIHVLVYMYIHYIYAHLHPI